MKTATVEWLVDEAADHVNRFALERSDAVMEAATAVAQQWTVGTTLEDKIADNFTKREEEVWSDLYQQAVTYIMTRALVNMQKNVNLKEKVKVD